jgi:hypothetical protein
VPDPTLAHAWWNLRMEETKPNIPHFVNPSTKSSLDQIGERNE